MPGPPRTYSTSALRQRAYRERVKSAREAPRAPAAARPGRARWRALVGHAGALLRIATSEMRDYYDERSEAWRDGERGESFLERLEALEEAGQALEDREF